MRALKMSILILLISIISCISISQKEKEIVSLLSDNKISITNLETDPLVQKKVMRILKNKTIIGLGEATHGTDEFFKLRCQFTKFLLDEMDYKTIAIEAGFQECMNLNNYVCYGEGNSQQLIGGLNNWFWQRDEMLLFIEWLKEWNSQKDETDKVRISGFDMQWRKESTMYIISFLSLYNPDLFKNYERQLNIIKDTELKPLPANIFEIIAIIENDLEINKSLYLSNAPENKYKITLQNIKILKQAEPFLEDRSGDRIVFEKLRDKFMAENIAWIYHFYEQSKTVVWAHNGHISKGERCGFLKVVCYQEMGSYLKDNFGESYYPIGFEFDKGYFKAFYNRKDFTSINVRSAPEFTLPYYLKKAQADNCFIDLNILNKSGSIGNKFLNTSIKSHSIGTFYYEKHRFAKMKISEHYEALIFVEQSSVPKLFE
jgi:erythromycin esterase